MKGISLITTMMEGLGQVLFWNIMRYRMNEFIFLLKPLILIQILEVMSLVLVVNGVVQLMSPVILEHKKQ